MTRNRTAFGLAGAAVVMLAAAGASAQQARQGQPMSEQEMIQSAMSAAPRAVAEKATIIAINQQGQTRTLRQGTGNFTCIPDDPNTPGNDPMCLDEYALSWAKAWMAKETPPQGMGLAYMLTGGDQSSLTDPFATRPTGEGDWVRTGPHLMIVGNAQPFQEYPTRPETTDVPYVMWQGTPYAHVMVPVGPEAAPQAAEVPGQTPGQTGR